MSGTGAVQAKSKRRSGGAYKNAENSETILTFHDIYIIII
jgi:hypothetical protein